VTGDGAEPGLVRLAGALRRASRCEQRYGGPPDEVPVLVVSLAGNGALDLGRPGRGTGGAWSQAGVYGDGSPWRGEPAVLVRTRAACELVTGWPGRAAARARTRGRATIGGPLGWPAHAAVSRAVREKQVLACMPGYPWQAAARAAMLRWHTWLTSVHAETGAALAVLARRGTVISAVTAGAGVRRRYAAAPGCAQQEAGGPDVPLVTAYLRRPASTEAAPRTALADGAGCAGRPAGGATMDRPASAGPAAAAAGPQARTGRPAAAHVPQVIRSAPPGLSRKRGERS